MWKRHPMLREERWIVQIYPASTDGLNPGFCLANTPSRMVNSLDSLYRGSDSLWTYVQAQTCLCFWGSNSCVRVLYFFVSSCYCESYQVFRWEWSLATSLCQLWEKMPKTCHPVPWSNPCLSLLCVSQHFSADVSPVVFLLKPRTGNPGIAASHKSRHRDTATKSRL